MPAKKTKTSSFEETLSELEALVESMEQGDLSLEDSLKSFEQGIVLTRTCQQTLKAAEQKVEILSQNTLNAEPEAFDSER